MPQDATDLNVEMDLPPKGPARIGGELRVVRERLGWPLQDVAEGLRIRLPYLEAIERGDLSALPGPAYQTGFVRTYAAALGLDAEEILRRFRAEGMGVATKAPLSFLAPVPDRAVPTGAVVLLGVVLVLVGYGLWFRHTAHERMLADAVPSVPAELAPLAMPKVVPPPALAPVPGAATPASKSVAPAPAAVPVANAPAATAASPAGSLPMPPPASSQIAAMQAPAATAAAQTPAPPPVTGQTPAAESGRTPAAQGGQTPAAESGQTIVATADSWVEVRDPTGNILFSRVLHAGESWPVPDIAGLTMTAGNAGATEIADGGKTSPPLGAAGTVMRHYALTPAAAAPPPPTQ